MMQAAPEAEEAPSLAMVPQLQRESPQHSSVYQSHAFSAGHHHGDGSLPDGMVVSPRSDDTDGSAFSLGSASDDDFEKMREEKAEHSQPPVCYDPPGFGDDERPGAGLLRPGALHSDGPLAEDREASL